ncbi:DUF3298 and DUF4163 domain-containing protein [Oscillibacter sp. MSJ-2]|uniref:DUF3298 and DUF4163 domain-containing protein n=1 Tax=Dysosmobacter acutus TaxID=2841504 RepID=A0ABS6FDH6_9FIRM|nr:DUF3298 and DUF4163 domain-containing protein [Dysosmobacter acutus]MBU5627607.1 DUF3298 and DUF4163 domain-containing protein [Dysosmobacter acutus]
MEKLIALFCALCLMAGCASVPPESEEAPLKKEPAAEKISQSVEKSAVYGAAVQTAAYTVESQIRADTVYDEDGALLVNYRYEVPHLTAWDEGGEPWACQDDDVAANLETFNGRFEEWLSGEDFQEKADEARAFYEDWKAERETAQSEAVWSREFLYDLSFTSYMTTDLISISGRYYDYSGGAHGMTVLLGWNYDLTGRRFIGPLELAADQAAFTEAVAREILAQIGPGDPLYWDDYDEIVACWPNYAVSFNEEGMEVGFSPYELACYAAGPQQFQISREFMEPYLSDYGRALLGYAA